MLDVDLVPVAPAAFVAPPARTARHRRAHRPRPRPRRSRRGPAAAGRRPRRRPGGGPRRLLVRLGPLHRDPWGAGPDEGGCHPPARPGRLRRDRVDSRRTPRVCPRAGSSSTDPDPGARVLDHGTIALTLSLGKERYDVPKLKGLDVDHAQDALLTVAPDLRPCDPAVVRHRAAGHRAGQRPGAGDPPAPEDRGRPGRQPWPAARARRGLDRQERRPRRAGPRPPAPRGAGERRVLRPRRGGPRHLPGPADRRAPPRRPRDAGGVEGSRARADSRQPPRDGRRGRDPASCRASGSGSTSSTPTSTSAWALSRAPPRAPATRHPRGAPSS